MPLDVCAFFFYSGILEESKTFVTPSNLFRGTQIGINIVAY